MTSDLNMDYSKYDFKDSTELYVYLSKKGLSRGTIEEISKLKSEPNWMREFRLRSFEVFLSKPMPNWGGDLSHIDFQNIYYYAKASDKQSKSWEEVPESVRNTFEKLGIPEAERKFLAGVGAQYESEVVYHNLREDLEKQGILPKEFDPGSCGFHSDIRALSHCMFMLEKMEKFVEDGDEGKFYRWLGFVQGILWSSCMYSINSMRDHNRNILN